MSKKEVRKELRELSIKDSLFPKEENIKPIELEEFKRIPFYYKEKIDTGE